MSAWSPQQAAEFKAAASVAFLRALAEDPKARLGLHRAAGIARAQGYDKVDVMGIRFSELPVAAENNNADPEEPLRQLADLEQPPSSGSWPSSASRTKPTFPTFPTLPPAAGRETPS